MTGCRLFVILSSRYISAALSFSAKREAGHFFSSSSASRALIALSQEWQISKRSHPDLCFRHKVSRTTSF